MDGDIKLSLEMCRNAFTVSADEYTIKLDLSFLLSP